MGDEKYPCYIEENLKKGTEVQIRKGTKVQVRKGTTVQKGRIYPLHMQFSTWPKITQINPQALMYYERA